MPEGAVVPPAKTRDADPVDPIRFEQLKLLFDYTKFHIGIYLTMATALVTLKNTTYLTNLHLCAGLIWAAIVCISVAGAAGGVVASNLPFHSDVEQFAKAKIGPWNLSPFKASTWMSIEHVAFWLALFSAGLAFLLAKGA